MFLSVDGSMLKTNFDISPAKVAGAVDTKNSYLTSKEVAGLLRISIRTLQEYRNQQLVPYYEIGRVILYKPEEIQDFINHYFVKPRFWREKGEQSHD
jgi:hypothetical protein